jgi:hypothetical protein
MYICNFMYMSCHFIAKNSLNSQGHPFPMAFVTDLPPIKGKGEASGTPPTPRHEVYLYRTI